ncbi:pyridoxal-phosphate dependent enzyme [Chryseobacterium suipulveris]|uniref:Pyridoxal-phosphate dependent enzyme n=1 Tax=Chryseobacterium suipulveris TaxID=2929800 RepID=A0ABY4BN44_9FLAO|nr:pyridoxal-phosphate dependent enzyme [Chryseobacterium suipulveris]UOE40608.1 pyridoxal-phosphate dependent enzyme [Chryseobacterium suipulveris]
MNFPTIKIPITEIPLNKSVRLFIKREDLIDPEISGNKFWKLFYNINHYLERNPKNPLIITFGGAFSNHISAVSALGKNLGIKTLGIIRGEELQQKWEQNPTLKFASSNGMDFRFVSREEYRNKVSLTKKLENEFPSSLIIPDGGTNNLAVDGIQHMLSSDTKSFNYLCTAVGTGGTIAGISKFAGDDQKVLGFKVVDDNSLKTKISELSGNENFSLIEADFGGYGKINDENIRFINWFSAEFGIQLDPIYTGKMMQKVFELIDEGFFPENSRILCFHTGGLQGIEGANEMLKKQNRTVIINRNGL